MVRDYFCLVFRIIAAHCEHVLLSVEIDKSATQMKNVNVPRPLLHRYFLRSVSAGLSRTSSVAVEVAQRREDRVGAGGQAGYSGQSGMSVVSAHFHSAPVSR